MKQTIHNNQKLRIIYAHGIHDGGGKTLLLEVLKAVIGNPKYRVILDLRMKESLKEADLTNAVFFPANFFGRLASETHLIKNRKQIKHVLSFNSLPFLLYSASNTTIFFQNVNLLRSPIASTREFTKSLFFRTFVSNDLKFLVQTSGVAHLLAGVTGKVPEVVTLLDPEVAKACQASQIRQNKTRGMVIKKTFFYISGDSGHKNHVNLIYAWKLIKDYIPNFNSMLYFTLADGERSTWNRLSKLADLEHLNVFNLGQIDHCQVQKIYTKFDALIYPSIQESCGLPLIEAAHTGCDIIGSEKDYLRDVCTPRETFDPNSPLSIARAVARYCGVNWPCAINPTTPDKLLEIVFETGDPKN
jgi:glycosyltransferase involved in cell wall biosynthesis